jgi:hypothetical protein
VAKETVTASWSPAHLNFAANFLQFFQLGIPGLSYHFVDLLTLVHDLATHAA